MSKWWKMCFLDKVLDIWHAKTCTKECTSVDMHNLKFDMWFDLWKKTHTSINTLEIERIILLGMWRSGRKCRCQWTFNLVFENNTWHFRYHAVEHHMKFFKHTPRWWVGCAKVKFCMSFYATKGKVNIPASIPPWSIYFNTWIVTCSQIFVFFALC